MSNPTIDEAKALAKKHHKNAVIIFYLDDEQMGYASYGKDRATCEQAKRLADAAYDAIYAALEEASRG